MIMKSPHVIINLRDFLVLVFSCFVLFMFVYLFFFFNSQSRSSVPPEILLMNWLFEKSIVSRSRNWCQIQIGLPACVMSSEYFTGTSLYLVGLKIFEWIGHLHQIEGNWAGRNFVTESRVNTRFITHARMWRWIWNLQLPTGSTFEK